jgi:hypothetical protein
MKKYIWIIIGIIVVVAVIAGAGYFLSARSGGNGAGIASSGTTPGTAAPSPSSSTAIQYQNSEYGFTFALPDDWQGYTTVTSTWTGRESCPSGECATATGTEILIRNPQWTAESPWQDIPIMVFTPTEWNAVASETLAVSAAPIPPSELGSNGNYVFALPARYNFAYPNGWQEVESIMQGNPLKAF